MSQQTVPLDDLWPLSAPVAAPARTPRPAAPGLRPAPIGRTRGAKRTLVGAFSAVATVAVILITQLVLSISTSEGAYEMANLELAERDLIRVERVLTQNVDKLASPQHLAENAGRLGMVMNSTPASLRLSDATILGNLETTTQEPQQITVPNQLLDALPALSAEGLTAPAAPAPAAPAAPTTPVVWDGPLPAPVTR